MIEFLIKSSIGLVVFLGFYHLLLQREKMHQFNRFYLLLSLVISLILPFFTFEIIKIIPVTEEAVSIPAMPVSFETVTEKTDYTPIILWTLYGLVTLVLLIRFGKNIWKLISKSRSNPTAKYKTATLVLMEEETLPHTFLNHIFINFDDYNQRSIEDELYTHELVHVTQKHTLDILFIEFLKTIFWFNPIFIFYKKAIQLNHEFLADEKVVESYNDVPFYQRLLLQKGNGNQTIYLASNLNYLVTKKRLIMMTKRTSKTMAAIKKFAVVPILAGLIYFLCIEVVAQEKVTSLSKNGANPSTDDKARDAYYKGVWVKVYDQRIGKKISDAYENLSLEEKRKYLDYVPKPYQKKSPTEKEFADFKNPKKYAMWIDSKHVANSELNKYQTTDFAYFSGSSVLKNEQSKKFPQPFRFALYTNGYFEKNMKNSHLKYSGDTIKLGFTDYNKALKQKKLAKIKADSLIWIKDIQDVQQNEKTKSIISELDENQDSPKKTEVVAVGKEENLTEPSFPGGISEFYKFVAKNFKTPKGAKVNKLIVSFMIEKDGSLSNIDVKKANDSETKEEAIRVLKISPKWIPATVKNEKVRYQYVLPIQIAEK